MKDPFVVKLDLERVDHWLSVGAQPTDTVKRLIDGVRSVTPESAAAEA